MPTSLVAGRRAPVGGPVYRPAMDTTVRIGDVPVAVEVHGSGTPLLMVHGWGVDRRLMTGCMEPLFGPDGPWQRIYPDLPGSGGTPGHPSIDSAEATAQLLVDLMDALAPGRRYAVVGESWGGHVARGVLARRPDLLGMALLCPAVRSGVADVDPPQAVVVDEDLLAELSAEQRRAFAESHAVLTRRVWERNLVEIDPGVASADQGYLEEVLGPRRRLVDDTATTDAPVLVLAGRQDAVVGYREQWGLAQRFPHATYAVIDAAGHNLQIEQPEVFEALVRAWLVRVSSAG